METQIHPAEASQIQEFDAMIDPETGELLAISTKSEFVYADSDRLAKQTALINIFKGADDNLDCINKEITRLKLLQTQAKNKKISVKWTLEQIMLANNQREVFIGTNKLRFSKNPPKVIIKPGAEIERFQSEEIVTTIDKAALKKALQDGEEIKGCSIEQGERLDIK